MGSRRSRRVQRVAVSGKEIRYCSMSSLLRLAVAVTHVRRGRGVAHNVVDEAVVHRLLGGEPTVAVGVAVDLLHRLAGLLGGEFCHDLLHVDRKSTRLNSSHVSISYAVFCLKKKTQTS